MKGDMSSARERRVPNCVGFFGGAETPAFDSFEIVACACLLGALVICAAISWLTPADNSSVSAFCLGSSVAGALGAAGGDTAPRVGGAIPLLPAWLLIEQSPMNPVIQTALDQRISSHFPVPS
jgi:hypothetical protein